MRPRKVILSVDTNEDRLSTRSYFLDLRGYRVIRASSAETALEVFHANESIDLVLSELMLTPITNGNDLAGQMKRLRPEVPVILICAYTSRFELACNADAFLPKGGCMPVEVLERIRVMIARKRGPRVAPDADPIEVCA